MSRCQYCGSETCNRAGANWLCRYTQVQRYDRALRALARHAKRLRKQRNAWAKAADQVDELNAKFIALRAEREAYTARLVRLRGALEDIAALPSPSPDLARWALERDAAFALVDPSGERRAAQR